MTGTASSLYKVMCHQCSKKSSTVYFWGTGHTGELASLETQSHWGPGHIGDLASLGTSNNSVKIDELTKGENTMSSSSSSKYIQKNAENENAVKYQFGCGL